MVRNIVALLLVLGCARAKPEEPKQDPAPAVVAQWQSAEGRLVASFVPDGFVVSIAHDASGAAPRNQGDALIWTGVALASMDCARGAKLDQALQDMVSMLNGGLWRHPSLPDQVSLDGALGFYLGVAHRITHCGEAATWKPLLALHQAVEPWLNVKAGVRLDDPFTAVRDGVLSLVGLAPFPAASRILDLEEAAALMGAAPRVARDTGVGSTACYRPHLGLLALQGIEAVGGTVSQAGRDKFCGATNGYGLATTDHWCGRGDIRAVVAGFQFDIWQFHPQRCDGWESRDGDGLWQPAVDLLRELADAYAFKF